MNRKKTAALAAAVCLTLAAFSGCKSKEPDNTPTETSVSSASEDSSAAITDISGDEGPQGLRPVAEGDVYAINKFVVDPLPADYQVVVKSQEAQGIMYVNGVSKITVAAANYKDDLRPLEEFADSACGTIKFNNMLAACDTDFSEPEKASVAGFDAIKYDFNITQNEFVKENEDDEGDGVKTPIGWYRSRAYFFYSDHDAFYIIFETKADDWDKTLGGFEEFVSLIKIDENAVNDPAETPADAAAAPEAETENAAEEVSGEAGTSSQ